MMHIFVVHNFLFFFLVSEQCSIGFIVANGFTEKKIIMFDYDDALEDHEIL